jgi:predicted DNA-binding WGR domain protein
MDLSRIKRIVVATPEQLEAKRKADAEAAERKRIADEARAIEETAAASRELIKRRMPKPKTSASAGVSSKVTLYAKSDGTAGDRGSRKQWSVWIDGRDVVTEWGREGAMLQQSRKTFTTSADCARHRQKLLSDKRAKGYK